MIKLTPLSLNVLLMLPIFGVAEMTVYNDQNTNRSNLYQHQRKARSHF
jgi:hypothetical protein